MKGKLESKIRNVLLSWSISGAAVVIMGGIITSNFLIILGLCLHLIGMIFANSLTQKQIIANLKKNNLWED